jgi:hypothetical protein
MPYKSKGFPHFDRIQAIIGTRTVRGVSAFRPSDQTRSTIANSVLTAPSSSTVIATGIGPLTHTLPATLNDRPDSSDNNGIPPPAPV